MRHSKCENVGHVGSITQKMKNNKHMLFIFRMIFSISAKMEVCVYLEIATQKSEIWCMEKEFQTKSKYRVYHEI